MTREQRSWEAHLAAGAHPGDGQWIEYERICGELVRRERWPFPMIAGMGYVHPADADHIARWVEEIEDRLAPDACRVCGAFDDVRERDCGHFACDEHADTGDSVRYCASCSDSSDRFFLGRVE